MHCVLQPGRATRLNSPIRNKATNAADLGRCLLADLLDLRTVRASYYRGKDVTDPGAVTLDVQAAQAAVLTVMRLFRALERVDTGLTPQQYRILKLAGAGGERSARLAERLAVAKPTLTATADGLVAAGYAQREAEPGDRRVVRLCLTAAGRAALERADAAYAGWLGPLLGATGDTAGVLEAFRDLDEAMDERRRAQLGLA
jgi:DNA-binding MarR family transcriptional regulator